MFGHRFLELPTSTSDRKLFSFKTLLTVVQTMAYCDRYVFLGFQEKRISMYPYPWTKYSRLFSFPDLGSSVRTIHAFFTCSRSSVLESCLLCVVAVSFGDEHDTID